jgi:hypothetical protein
MTIMCIGRWTWCFALVAAFAVVAVGCKKEEPTRASKQEEEEPEKGPREGPLAEWGDHLYFVEVKVEGKEVVVYLLDKKAKNTPAQFKDAAKIKDVEIVFEKPSAVEKLKLALSHDVEKSKGEQGLAFSAKDDKLAGVKESEIKGEISGKLDDKPYQGEFPHEH